MPTSLHNVLGAIFASVLLLGCAHHTVTPPHRTVATPPSSSAPTGPAKAPPVYADTVDATDTTSATPTGPAALPEKTGISACDDYLASYLGCHRAAHIYAPDQLPIRFQAMRTSLLRDSMDATIRPQLARRCNALATQLHEALHGKPCIPTPDPASP